jgi:acyl carrier protein
MPEALFKDKSIVTNALYDVLLKRFPKLDRARLTPAATFAELGLDSLDIIEAAVLIEQKFECEMKEDDIFKLKTIGELIDFVTWVPNAQSKPVFG